jgi:ribonuclease PH
LKDLAVACTAGQIHGQHILDLNHYEETSDCSSVFVAVHPSLDEILVLQTLKRQTQADFEALLTAAMTGCAEVYGQMQQALRDRLKQLAVGAGRVEA